MITSFVASAIDIQPPQYNQDAAAIVAWFAENSRPYRVGHFVAGLAFLLFYVPFFAGLCEKLRAAEGTPAIWSRVTWAGAMLSRDVRAEVKLVGGGPPRGPGEGG